MKKLTKIAKKVDEFDPLSPKGFRLVIFFFTVIIAILAILYITIPNMIVKEEEEKEILGENVIITGYIPWTISFKITSEKRIPPTNNQQNDVSFEIRYVGTNTVVYSENVSTNNSGVGNLSTILPGDLGAGNYDIAIKGLSHLKKLFSNKAIGPQSIVYLDLSANALPAGDSHPSSDNYVNSLDFAYEVYKMDAPDTRADITRDGIINSLDFNAIANHVYETGVN